LLYKAYILIFISLLFNSCGYKPSISYASNQLSGDVYVSVDIDINNAKNSILIKDELIKLVINTFNLTITQNKNQAQSFLNGKLLKVTHLELLSDTNGFAKVYRETVEIEITYHKKNQANQIFKLKNYYDFSVDIDSTITQSKKDEAISIAIAKALNNLFSKIAVNSQK
jgi:DNA-binding protein YbaB